MTREVVKKLLKGNNVGIFGCGNVWRLFYASGDAFAGDDYTLIDETPFLQRNGWNGRKVYSPTVIKERKIDTIISMIRSSKKEISEKLLMVYNIDGVNIIPCYDLDLVKQSDIK